MDFHALEMAVNADGWRWMPGMLLLEGHRVLGTCTDARGRLMLEIITKDREVFVENPAGLFPDFNDPTTLACLESLVRHKHGIDVRVLDCGDFRVRVVKGGLQGQPYVQMVQDTSRAQALITALRKSPEPDTP